MNFKEPYSSYLNINRVIDLFLQGYDVVIAFGTDVVIKKNIPITNYISPDMGGIIMCREVANKHHLNGDFIIMINHEWTMNVLRQLDMIHYRFNSSQDAINYLQCPVGESPYLQVAAPVLNPLIDYSHIDLDKYFSFHYHTIGERPCVMEKAEGMKHDLGVL